MNAEIWGFPMSFAKRIASRRKELGLTQQALAAAAGIHVMQVHRYENEGAQPSLEVLKKLAIALRVSADHLLFEEDERSPADELKLQFEAVSRLDPEERRVIQEVVDSILLKHDAKRWIRSDMEAPPQKRSVGEKR